MRSDIAFKADGHDAARLALSAGSTLRAGPDDCHGTRLFRGGGSEGRPYRRDRVTWGMA
jgi:hypothetical protein